MKKKILRIPLFIALGIAGIFVIGNVFILLWNELATTLFHLPVITFWQGLGLLLLTRLLFGGIGSHNGHKCRPKIHGEWHKRFEEKLASMNPEEREKYWEARKKHFDCNYKENSEPGK